MLPTYASLLFLAASLVLSKSTTSLASPFPFNITPAFIAHLNLGPPLHPIPLPPGPQAGVRIVEPILNGTVTGPLINGTIYPGLALPIRYNSTTGSAVQVPVIELYGVTDDGLPFYLFELGVGPPRGQMTRIQVEIGGQKYAKLRDGFLLASVTPNEEVTGVVAKGFLVENTDY